LIGADNKRIIVGYLCHRPPRAAGRRGCAALLTVVVSAGAPHRARGRESTIDEYQPERPHLDCVCLLSHAADGAMRGSHTESSVKKGLNTVSSSPANLESVATTINGCCTCDCGFMTIKN